MALAAVVARAVLPEQAAAPAVAVAPVVVRPGRAAPQRCQSARSEIQREEKLAVACKEDGKISEEASSEAATYHAAATH
jgi:hypothetical protein